MKTVKINENLNLHYIRMTKLKTTSVSVYIHRPLNNVESSYNALLPMVLKSASRVYPSREAIAEKLDNLYGATMGATVLKKGEDQAIYFDAETISDKYAPDGEKLLPELIRVLMSVIFDPKVTDNGFDEEITEQEKKNAIDKIDAFINDKRKYALVRCQNETARDTAYAVMWLGEKKAISNITAKALYEYYKSIINSSVTDIYICGEADILEIENVMKEYVSGIDFKKASLPGTKLLKRDIGKINNVTEHMPVAQGKLSIGYITNISPQDNDSYALSVFNSVFGGGAHSKLFNNVREKLSLAYYASSQLVRMKGMLIVNAGIEFENFEKARDEVFAQLEEVKNGNISEQEFTSSIKALVNACNSYYDDQRALASFTLNERMFGTNRTLEEYIENIKKVTVDDVVEVAKKIQLDTVYFLAGEEE